MFLKRFSAEIIALTLAMVLLLPFCGVVFGCGCTLMTGLRHCNIHDPAPPNCPWCSGTLVTQYLPVIAIASAAIGGPTLLRKLSGAHRFWFELAVGLLCAFVAAVLIAWIYALVWDYPNFLLIGGLPR